MNEIWDIRWDLIVHSFVQKYTFVIVNSFENIQPSKFPEMW